MPQMKRGRGYSHWNPSRPEPQKIYAELNIPRIVKTHKQASKLIVAWACNPNAYRHFTSNGYLDDADEDIGVKPDGRTKNDLEVVKVELRIR